MNNRDADLQYLRQTYRTTSDPKVRQMAERAARRIRNEGPAIKSMREALIREHRNGNQDNIKDIHAYIEHKQKYQNE